MNETTTPEEEIQVLDREIASMEAELREVDAPIVWGEAAAEELEARERRRAILPRLITAARAKRLELQQEGYRRQLEPLGAECEQAYQKLQKALEKEHKAKEEREAAQGEWRIKLSATQNLKDRIRRTQRELRELKGEDS
jgi:chromosome segregation ATPase